MADGLTHNKYLRLGWIIVIPFGLLLFLFLLLRNVDKSYLYLFVFYLNYCICEIIDPDSDQLGLTSSEGRVLRGSRKYYIGFLGAIFVSYSFIYAYFIGLFGGHRSWLSHGWAVGTIGRMIYFNIPMFLFMYFFYTYAVTNWEATPHASIQSIFFWDYTKIYILTQFIAWNIGDGIHLILDTEWAKGRLYQPKRNEANIND